MEQNKKNPNLVGGIVAVVVAVGFMWYFYGGGLEKQAGKEMQRIENQVAADAVRQYEIAKRSGSAMDACVQADLVAAAYLQAKDEANYQKWKAISREEHDRAGVPQD